MYITTYLTWTAMRDQLQAASGPVGSETYESRILLD